MSDEELSEIYRLRKEISQKKRALNRERSAQMLRDHGILFETKNGGAHSDRSIPLRLLARHGALDGTWGQDETAWCPESDQTD